VYSLLPHAGSFQDSGVIREAYNLNVPLVKSAEPVPVVPSPAPLFVVDNPAVVLETVKKAEDDDSLILRMYESFGSTAQFQLTVTRKMSQAVVVNILEEEDNTLGQVEVGTVGEHKVIRGTLTPFKVLTLKLK
jgi:alpha-mannosidase